MVLACLLVAVVAGRVAADTEISAEFRGGIARSEPYDNRLLRVDVFVRGEENQPVQGLGQDDFKLLVDGTVQKIELFSAFEEVEDSATEVAAGANPQSSPQHVPTYLVIYVDNQNLRGEDRDRFLRALQEYLRSGLDEKTQVMIVTSQREKPVDIVRPFTNDVRELVHALRGVRLSETALEERDEEREEILRAIQRAGENRHHSTSTRQREQSDIFADINNFAAQQGEDLAETLSAMRQMFTTLTGLEGRKHVLYVSNGLPVALGAQLLHRFAGLRVASVNGSQAFSRSRLRQYEVVTAAANSQGIAIHPVDVTGSDPFRFSIGETDSRRAAASWMVGRENHQASLKLLANQTGGTVVINTDEFLPALQRIWSAFSSYYSIGCVLANPGSDTIHHVEVQLPGEPGAELSFRRTFVSKSLETVVQERVTSRLFIEFEHNPLGVEVSKPLPVRATETRWQLLVPVSLPVPSLRLEREGDEYVGTVIHFVALRNHLTGSMDSQRQEHVFRVPVDEYEARQEETFPIYLRLLVDPGRNTVVVGLLDATTQRFGLEAVEATVGD